MPDKNKKIGTSTTSSEKALKRIDKIIDRYSMV